MTSWTPDRWRAWLHPFRFALLLPLAFTAVTLTAVAWNRSAGRGPIVLSERETTLIIGSGDDTTARLWLSFQPLRRTVPGSNRPPAIEHELRRGFAALELRDEVPDDVAGPALEPGMPRPRPSRLVVVDIDPDATTLERRYPDGRTHIIAAATISIPEGGSYADGTVISLEPQQIQVPRALVAQFPRSDASRMAAPGAYEVELWYGVRYEPWITAIRRR